MLTLRAEQVGRILRADSLLLEAVLDFGNAWLQSAGKLTLHDPLAAACIFYPDLCNYEKGFVQVETEQESRMGGTVFTPSADGNVEIAKDVNIERFYRVLCAALYEGRLAP